MARLWLTSLAPALLACGSAEPPPTPVGSYVVQAELSAGTGATWSLRLDDLAPLSTTGGSISIGRGFATEADARAFVGEFAVTKDGVEIGRDTARFAACDEAVSLVAGFTDPHVAVVRRIATDGTLAPGADGRGLGAVGCYASLEARTGRVDTSRLVARYFLPVARPFAGPVVVRVDGSAVSPLAVEILPDQVFLVIDVPFPAGTAPSDARATLSVEVSGDASDDLEVNFAPCIASGPTVGPLARQDLWVTLSPRLHVDERAGTFCHAPDGNGWGTNP